jgi:hypothetical protein
MMENSSRDITRVSETSGMQVTEPTEPIDRNAISKPTSPGGKDDCYLMLAQVNLLRIRKQPQAALELCETVLKKWPFRADAHALIGDLYQELGQIDDAILRYCRVLELDPKNNSNRQKLAGMVRLKRQLVGPAEPEGPRASGLRVDRFVRAIILAMATVMLVTIMATPVIFVRRSQIENQQGRPTTVDRTINLNPIILQPAQPLSQTDGSGGATTQTENIIRDPVEQALVNLMGNDKSLLQLGIQVLDAQEDPVVDGCTITFLDRSGPNAVSRLTLLRHSLIVAQYASNSYGARDVRQFTLRCLLLTPTSGSTAIDGSAPITGTTSLVYEGTIQRNTIPSSEADIDSAAVDQLQPYFTNTWWADDIQ